MKKILLAVILSVSIIGSTNANLDYVEEGLTETLTGSFSLNEELNSDGNLLYGANLKLGNLYFYKNNFEDYLDGEYLVEIKWNKNLTFDIIETEKINKGLSEELTGDEKDILNFQNSVKKINSLQKELDKLIQFGPLNEIIKLDSEIEMLSKKVSDVLLKN